MHAAGPAFASRPRLVAAAFPARMALWCAVVMRRVGARAAANVLCEYRDAVASFTELVRRLAPR